MEWASNGGPAVRLGMAESPSGTSRKPSTTLPAKEKHNGFAVSKDWEEGFFAAEQQQQAPGERRPLRHGDVVLTTDAGLSLEAGRGDQGIVRCAQAPLQNHRDTQWKIGWGKVQVRVQEKLERDIACGDILCPSGANDGTSTAVCANELEDMALEDICWLGKSAFAVVLDASPSSETIGQRVEPGVRTVLAWQAPGMCAALTAELARRLGSIASEHEATKALAEQALAKSSKTEKALCNLQARLGSFPDVVPSTASNEMGMAQQLTPSSSSPSSDSAPTPNAGPTPMDCSDELKCSYCSQTDHDKEDCPSQVLVDLRSSGDMAPVRRNSQSPRVGSKRSNSESSLVGMSGRSMLTQSSPALRTGLSGGSPTKKKKKSIATSAGASLKRSGNYMALGDPRAKNINAIIGLPRLAEIPIAFPPQKDELIDLLSAGEGRHGLHIISLAKTGRHTQEDIVSVLGCIGPNPIFKKMKLLFMWIPDTSGRSHSKEFKPIVTVKITRLHPDHPSTLVIEGDRGRHSTEASFELSPRNTVPITLRPDHPRKVGGHSALFDVEVLVGQRKVVEWNVQVYNSRYGPRLVHERPERTPYSRPPAVCTFSYSEGMWSPGVAFLRDLGANEVPNPPAKMRRTDDASVSHARSSSLSLTEALPAKGGHARMGSAPMLGQPSPTLNSTPAPVRTATPPMTPSAAAQAAVSVAEAAAAAAAAATTTRSGENRSSDGFHERSSSDMATPWGGSFSNADVAAAAAAAAMAGTTEARGHLSGFSQLPSQPPKEPGTTNWRRAPIGSKGMSSDNGSSTTAPGLVAGSRGGSGQTTFSAAAAAAAAYAATSPSVSAMGTTGRMGSGGQGFASSRMLGPRGSKDGMAYPRLVYSSLNSFGNDSEATGQPMEQPPP